MRFGNHAVVFHAYKLIEIAARLNCRLIVKQYFDKMLHVSAIKRHHQALYKYKSVGKYFYCMLVCTLFTFPLQYGQFSSTFILIFVGE
jgi:hypothetical protein